MDADERQLVDAFRAGDDAALDEAYRRYGPRVMAFATHVTGNRADAEDLTQETFLSAFAGRSALRGRSGLLTWLFGIATRRWRDSRRKRSTAEVPMVDVALERQAPQTQGPSLDPIRLRDAMATLDTDMGTAFHLVFVQGLTHAEAAAAMDRPVGTVKWYTATAVRRLREVLQDDPGTDTQGVRANQSRGPDRAAEGRTEPSASLGAAGSPVAVRSVH